MKLCSSALVLAAAATACTLLDAPAVLASSRDNSYYRPGFVNPNLASHPLYHKNAINVLEKLANFQALYVQYENCAWAYYGNPYANRYDDSDNYGWDDRDRDRDRRRTEGGGGGEMQVRGCGYNSGGGGDYGGESSHWYMGRTACFRAQAAYSLYGIPADGSVGGGGDNDNTKKCKKATYINSFFTTMGVEAFAAPLGIDTTYGNAYCTMIPPEDGNVAMNDDDDDAYDDTKYNFQAFTSYGTGCSRGKFVSDSYQGAFCDGNEYVETTNTLDDFNKALNELDCVQIYDAGSGYAFKNGNGGDNGGGDEDEGGGYYTDENGYAFYYDNEDYSGDTPVAMLQHSVACDVDQYPDSCPDPHGLLRKYKKALSRSLNLNDLETKSVGEKVLYAFTGIFFFVAFLLTAAAIRKRRRIASKPAMDASELTDQSTLAASPAPNKKRSFLERRRTGDSKRSAQAAPEAEPMHQRQPSAVSVVAASVAASVLSVKEALECARTPSKVQADSKPDESAASGRGSERNSANADADADMSYYAPGDDGVIVHKMKIGNARGEAAAASSESIAESKSKSKKKSGLLGRFRRR